MAVSPTVHENTTPVHHAGFRSRPISFIGIYRPLSHISCGVRPNFHKMHRLMSTCFLSLSVGVFIFIYFTATKFIVYDIVPSCEMTDGRGSLLFFSEFSFIASFSMIKSYDSSIQPSLCEGCWTHMGRLHGHSSSFVSGILDNKIDVRVSRTELRSNGPKETETRSKGCDLWYKYTSLTLYTSFF